jgi:glycosyltransferase involved in cell wall biosynthesis
MKPTLRFYTNIPSPYNLDLFESLSNHFQLEVIYYSKIESDRQWDINTDSAKYVSKVLKNNFIGRFIQRFKTEFHFSLGILNTSFNDESNYVILGGNYFSPNTYIVLLVSYIKKKKIFWFGERLFPTNNWIKKIIKRILISPINLISDGIFAVGKSAVESYREYGYSKAIINTPYSINNDKFLSNPDFSSFLRLNKTSQEKIIIISSGSLIHRKGFDVSIEALNLIDDNLLEKVEYWIMGDGHLKEKLKMQAKPSLTIRFIGFVNSSDLYKYYQKADIFLFTSRYDGWGVVVNEAMASGLPIVVTKYCGASEYVNRNGGFVVDINPIDINAKLIELIKNEGLRREMGLFNLQKSNEISSEKIAESIYMALKFF